jgi:mannose-6-phosphate isomerase-like protein (cupin superfamily)
MRIKLTAKPLFTAGDKTMLRELFHPKNDGLDLGYSIAHAYIERGCASIPHRLTVNSEVYYFIKGVGKFFLNEEVLEVEAGDLVIVPANAWQWVENAGETNLEFLCIVSPPWSSEQEEVVSQ